MPASRRQPGHPSGHRPASERHVSPIPGGPAPSRPRVGPGLTRARASEEILQGVRKGAHEARCQVVEPRREQAADERSGGRLAEFGGRPGDDQGRVEPERPGDLPGECHPIEDVRPRDVNQARSPKFCELYGGACDVGSVARARRLVGRAGQGLAGAEGFDRLVGEVLPLAFGAEDPGGPDGQLGIAQLVGKRVLGVELGATVGGQGPGGVRLVVGAGDAVEDVIGREVDETSPEVGGGAGEVQGLFEVGGAGAGGVALAAVDPGEPGRVEDDVGLLSPKPGRRGVEVGRIEVGQAGESGRGIRPDRLMTPVRRASAAASRRSAPSRRRRRRAAFSGTPCGALCCSAGAIPR